METQSLRDTLVIETLKTVEEDCLVIFSSNSTATFSPVRIIYDEKKKQLKMKHKGFFTMLILPFHFMAFGQTEFSINAGSSNMWLQHNTSTVTNQIWTGAHIGAEIMTPVKNSNFSIVSGLNIKYVQRTYSYNQKNEIDNSLSSFEYDYATLYTKAVLNELNTGMFTAPCIQLSVPLKVCYRYNKWQACVGAEYQLSGFLFQTHEADNSSFDEDAKTVFNDIGIVAGLGYSLSKHVGVSFDCFQGFIGKYNYFEDEFYPTLGVSEYYFKSLSVDLNIVYTF